MRDPNRDFLRHTLATIAYRAAKAERDTPPGFADFQAGNDARTPLQIVAHMGDLFDWAHSMAEGKWDYKQSAPLQWRKEVARFPRADIVVGRLGAEQPRSPFEFD